MEYEKMTKKELIKVIENLNRYIEQVDQSFLEKAARVRELQALVVKLRKENKKRRV